MTGPQIIVLATPVFLALIGIELADRPRPRPQRLPPQRRALQHRPGRDEPGRRRLHRGADARHLRLACTARSPSGSSRRRRRGPGSSALVAYDFLYYWHHRAGHRVALFWAAHVVHHQSEDYNLSTALRQTSSGWLAGWIFYLPMAIAGFPPLVFAVVALIDLLYQFWVHTEQVGRLGWFDRWFCAPSNHRVHHAVNDAYLDRNYGGVLLRLGPAVRHYAEEDDAVPCVYGTRGAAAQLEPDLGQPAGLRRARAATRGTRAAGATSCASGSSRPAGGRPTSRRAGRRRRSRSMPSSATTPVVAARAGCSRCCLFVALLAATTLFLWHAHALGWRERAACALAIGVGLWVVGRLSEGAASTSAPSAYPRPRAAAGIAMIEDRLPPSLLEALAAHGNSRAFRAHTILINEGDRAARSTSSSTGGCAPTRARRGGATSSSPSTGRASTSASSRSTARRARRR